MNVNKQIMGKVASLSLFRAPFLSYSLKVDMF